jgi:hypothetical protein
MSTASHPTAPTSLLHGAVAALVAWVCLAGPSASAGAQGVDPGAALADAPASFAVPSQGLYEGCAPGTARESCAAHLATIRAAGFHYVLNYSSWYGSPAAVLHYADVAASLGLELIWPLNHPAWRGAGDLSDTYPDLGEGRADLSNADFASLAIGLVVNHPATWGFYIGDEVSPLEADAVGALSATVRRLAPGKQQLYVARPGAALLEPFAPFVDVAGADTYPIGSAERSVRHAARAARAVASEAGAQTAMVLQAFSWSQYRPGAVAPRYPNGRILRMMRDAAIHHANPAMILWYSFQDVLRSDQPRRRWRQLSRAAFSPGDSGHTSPRIKTRS